MSVEDTYGNVETASQTSCGGSAAACGVNDSITIAPSGSTLNGTLTVAATAGQATFSGLSMNTAGSYTLSATDNTSHSPSVSGTTSSSFTITASTPNMLVFTTRPTTPTGANFSTTVSVEDIYGNVETASQTSCGGSAAACGVNDSITIAPSGSTLNGTLTVSATAGQASFSGLSINPAGSYTLSATDNTSHSPSVAGPPRPASPSPSTPKQLVFTTQPATPTGAGAGFLDHGVGRGHLRQRRDGFANQLRWLGGGLRGERLDHHRPVGIHLERHPDGGSHRRPGHLWPVDEHGRRVHP